MKYWKISYYRTHNWIDTKYIKDEYAQGAINKARVKNIVDIEEISEEEYKAGRNAAAVVTSPGGKEGKKDELHYRKP
jgi:hypothetical protein